MYLVSFEWFDTHLLVQDLLWVFLDFIIDSLALLSVSSALSYVSASPGENFGCGSSTRRVIFNLP